MAARFRNTYDGQGLYTWVFSHTNTQNQSAQLRLRVQIEALVITPAASAAGVDGVLEAIENMWPKIVALDHSSPRPAAVTDACPWASFADFRSKMVETLAVADARSPAESTLLSTSELKDKRHVRSPCKFCYLKSCSAATIKKCYVCSDSGDVPVPGVSTYQKMLAKIYRAYRQAEASLRQSISSQHLQRESIDNQAIAQQVQRAMDLELALDRAKVAVSVLDKELHEVKVRDAVSQRFLHQSQSSVARLQEEVVALREQLFDARLLSCAHSKELDDLRARSSSSGAGYLRDQITRGASGGSIIHGERGKSLWELLYACDAAGSPLQNCIWHSQNQVRKTGIFHRTIFSSNGAAVEMTSKWFYNSDLPWDIVGPGPLRDEFGLFFYIDCHESTPNPSPELHFRKLGVMLTLARTGNGLEWLSYASPCRPIDGPVHACKLTLFVGPVDSFWDLGSMWMWTWKAMLDHVRRGHKVAGSSTLLLPSYYWGLQARGRGSCSVGSARVRRLQRLYKIKLVNPREKL
ncbi:MAG: hypothetical protein SGPRY_012192 [Prymnesium sp.]